MNQLPARIYKIETDGNISLVELKVNEFTFSVLVIDTPDSASYLKEGNAVTLVFKEIEVSLGKNLAGSLSLRNRLPATITFIEEGKLLTNIHLSFQSFSISSVITSRSAKELDLQIGQAVEALVKATDITLVHDI